MNTKKLVYSSGLIAISFLIPQIFHVAGAVSGSVFLPMHIGILISGFIVGPYYAMLIGLIVPVLSSVITQMPPVPMVYFMIFELMAYGFIAGYCYEKLKFNKILSLVISLIGGRIVYVLIIFIASNILGLPYAFLGFAATIEKFVVGIPGVLIQLAIIPLIVVACEKGGLTLVYRRNHRSNYKF